MKRRGMKNLQFSTIWLYRGNDKNTRSYCKTQIESHVWSIEPRHCRWSWLIFTCVSYAEARNRYRLDVRLSVWPSVRPSVRPSVTRWHCIKTAERIVLISSPHDSPFILVLCIPRSSRNSDGVTPCGDAIYRWGIKFARFSTNKSLYLANDTIYRRGCFGRRIGNRTQAFEWPQFQWPWGTSKPVFKVTILFNVK